MHTHCTKSVDGATIAYDIQGSGPALFLLHGLSQDRTLWRKLGWVERLEREFTVVTVDLRGCGESDAPATSAGYGADLHAADISAVAVAAEIDRYAVWGWSFGGTVALQLASRNEPRLTRAVVAGTYFGRVFTTEYVRKRLETEADPLMRTRLTGFESWPSVEPEAVCCPMLVYTGENDGNVVIRLQEQRREIEATGTRLQVFGGLNHGQLISAGDVVWPLVHAFLSDE